MKTVVLQVTGLVLRLTPVHEEKNGRSFGATEETELPEKLKNGGVFSNPAYFAGFLSNSMLGKEYQKSRVIFCLDGSQVVTKEYPHLHIEKEKYLLQSARLNAESVLHGDVSNYVVTASASGYVDSASGEEKSVLYAAPKGLIKNIIRELGRKKIKVAKIVPPITGFVYSCRALLKISPENAGYSGKTVGVIDFGKEKSRLAVFSSGAAVFQKDFDSAYDEIIDLLEKSENMHRGDAEKLVGGKGFLIDFAFGKVNENTSARIKALLNASIGEIMRSIRAVLGAKRLDMDKFIICGAAASHPDFNVFIKNRLLGIPFDNIASSPAALGIQLDSRAVVNGAKAAEFFTLYGVLTVNGRDDVDFMFEQNNVQKIFLRYVYASIVIITALAAALTVQGIIYRGVKSSVSNDSKMLNSAEITNIKELLDSADAITAKNKQAMNYKKSLPYRKSHSGEIFTQLQSQVFPHVKSVETCSIDNKTGTVTLQFTTADIESFNSVRKSVENGGYFKVMVPFTVSKDTGSDCKCSTVLAVDGFTPLTAASGASSQKAAGESK